MFAVRNTVMALVILSLGCGGTKGPDMGLVTGVVTMDGKPVKGARVTYIPQVQGGKQSGSTSFGATDDEGHYELTYSNTQMGAVIGTHVVRISTRRAVSEDDNGKSIPGASETIPAEYNIGAAKNPDMSREVKAGPNTIDFALKGSGKVIQIRDSNN